MLQQGQVLELATREEAATRLRLASRADPRLACDPIAGVPAETPANAPTSRTALPGLTAESGFHP
jgi:hypothetical protein